MDQKRLMKCRKGVLVTLILAMITVSCSTTKRSRQDTGFLGKKYHDVTAKFNGYFNADEIYKTSILDKVIEKVTKVAALHEPSKWLDDCYVLMGKAQYLKGDLESAQETFEYFVKDFNPKDPESRVYNSPDADKSTKERRKEAQRERKIVEEERKAERKEKEKSRKQIQKER